MKRVSVASHAPWEDQVGYGRLVKVGRHIYVTGTTALQEDGTLAGPGDAYVQARQCLRNIESALSQVDADLSDVVRTRLYVVDIERDWEPVGRAHKELLGEHRPAATMIQISRLIDPAMLIEIEADAVMGAGKFVLGDRPRIVEANFEQDSDLAAMLRRVDLPMPTGNVRVLKAYVGGELCGCVGYERYGDAAVLHSLVVVREAKGEGVGRGLVETLIDRLQRAGVREIFLATQDTARYFGYLGFSPVERTAIAPEVLASPGLSSYAEGEAIYMRRALSNKPPTG